MIDYQNTLKITKPLYLATSKSIDIKDKISTLSDIKDILFPYKGMQFFVNHSNDWYKVETVVDGYLVYATGQYSPTQPSGQEFTHWERVSNLYIGTYSPMQSSGSGANLNIGSTPNPETNVMFDAEFPSYAHGDIILDVTKSKQFTKTDNGWYAINVVILPDDEIVPTISGAEVQPFK